MGRPMSIVKVSKSSMGHISNIGACFAGRGIPKRYLTEAATTAGCCDGSTRDKTSSKTLRAQRATPGTVGPRSPNLVKNSVSANRDPPPKCGDCLSTAYITNALTNPAAFTWGFNAPHRFPIAVRKNASNTSVSTLQFSAYLKKPWESLNRRAVPHGHLSFFNGGEKIVRMDLQSRLSN